MGVRSGRADELSELREAAPRSASRASPDAAALELPIGGKVAREMRSLLVLTEEALLSGVARSTTDLFDVPRRCVEAAVPRSRSRPMLRSWGGRLPDGATRVALMPSVSRWHRCSSQAMSEVRFRAEVAGPTARAAGADETPSRSHRGSGVSSEQLGHGSDGRCRDRRTVRGRKPATWDAGCRRTRTAAIRGLSGLLSSRSGVAELLSACCCSRVTARAVTAIARLPAQRPWPVPPPAIPALWAA
jgi:hypothetical protein